ncbi:hypothetical protein IP70_06905 [alpha proteobacterium AAP38]|uniref:hypothetical protein n=1 Tax=Niveispirillum sp. TaxID=1917217 RepID=UPI0006B9733F|nr:hypothetical protein IP70_06905 [alpha proteobacterium AAP38]
MTDQKALGSGTVAKAKVSEVTHDTQKRQVRLGLEIMDQYAETYEVLEAVDRVIAEHEWVLKELAR